MYFFSVGKTTTVRAFIEMSFGRVGMPLRWEGEGVNEVGIFAGCGGLPACMLNSCSKVLGSCRWKVLNMYS